MSMPKKFVPYYDYIQSEAWGDKKYRFWINVGKPSKKFCFACMRTSGNFEIHHFKGYETLGEEDPKEDLVSLCRDCHQACHFLPDGTKLANTPEVLRARYYEVCRQKQKLRQRNHFGYSYKRKRRIY